MFTGEWSPTFGRDIAIYVDGTSMGNSSDLADTDRRSLFNSGSDNAYFHLKGVRGT